jgi:hypothetical protein
MGLSQIASERGSRAVGYGTSSVEGGVEVGYRVAAAKAREGVAAPPGEVSFIENDERHLDLYRFRTFWK